MFKAENYDLSAQNTFRMKVKCACYIEYESVAELEQIDFASLPQPVVHIGGGSNLLFTGDFPGTVLHSAIRYVKYVDLGLDEVFMTVGAGVCFDEFVAKACEAPYWGAENLSLIPGEVGAAAVQNIGAYGVEVKDIIAGVTCFDTVERKKVSFKVGECGYGYRESRFKGEDKGRYIITGVLFKLTRAFSPKLEYKGIREALGMDVDAQPDQNLTPMAVREAVIRIRNQKLPDPDQIGSAGSFFKNPVVSALQFANIVDIARKEWGEDVKVPHFVLDGGFVKVPAAWLIDRCGFKGVTQGGAAVYEKQPLVIVNASGDAAPSDIVALEQSIISTVKERFGVELHPEVEHI